MAADAAAAAAAAAGGPKTPPPAGAHGASAGAADTSSLRRKVSGGPCAPIHFAAAPAVLTQVTNGHILEVINRCNKHQRALTRCSARWREHHMEQLAWDCGGCEWNVYLCIANIVCPDEAREFFRRCPTPAPSAPSAASSAPDCAEPWSSVRRCLAGHSLHLRWNGERDCRSSSSL
eukprot:TRINITY_DN6842_c0_g2_i1.p1 TRINITY_DN6842_c0_g2~~TRINITY_DN6842_c0_g2_i1.p1  ORF type:complete len:192 (-),score=36.02 TRINITY_DN6842_c0_g2_i1:68-595(-)